MHVRSSSLSIALFWLSVLMFLAFSMLTVIVSWMPDASGKLVGPLIIYGLAHFLRALRLGVLLNTVRARLLLALHFYTAACSAVIPFKLGELVRVNEIARWSGGYWRGLVIVWIERVFDVLPLVLMAFYTIRADAQEAKHIGLLLWALGGFVFLTVIIFFIVPEQLRGLNLHVLRSYKGAKAVNILRVIDACYQIFDEVRPQIVGKLVTLSLLTLFIWGTELLAISMLFEFSPWLDAVASLMAQFTQVLVNNRSNVSSLANFEYVKILSLIAVGLLSLAFYGQWRITSR